MYRRSLSLQVAALVTQIRVCERDIAPAFQQFWSKLIPVRPAHPSFKVYLLRQCRDARHGRDGSRHCAGEGFHRAAGVSAPSARDDAFIPARGRALSRVSGSTRCRGSTAAAVRGRRVRRLSQVRLARARFSAGQVRRLPGREARGIFVQTSRLLPELRRAADGRDGGTARGRRPATAAGSPMGVVAAVCTALPARNAARGGHASARYCLPGDLGPSDSQSRSDARERGDRGGDPDTTIRQCAQSQCPFPPARARRRLSAGG